SAMSRSDSWSAMNTVTAGVAGVCAFSREALYVARSKYDFGRFDFSYAFHARGLIVTMATPGGAPQAFCDAVMQTSTPHSSISSSVQPAPETLSRRKSFPDSRTTGAMSLI